MRRALVSVLDKRVSQADPPQAIAAIDAALKLTATIIADAGEPRHRRIRASNPAITGM